MLINSSIYNIEISILYKNQSNLILSELFVAITIVILITTINYNKYFNINNIEYVIFILVSLGSWLVFINVFNFILIYIILELQSIIISVLISIKKFNRYSIEASIKYFILGSFSSLILLFGVSIIYGTTGMLSMYDLILFLEYFEQIDNELVIISIKSASIFILVGLLFKIYSAPFHFWLPDIYEGSPTSVLVYITTVPSIVLSYFFLKVYYYIIFDITEVKHYILVIISVLTLLFGSIGALIQKKIKKLISFSTITMNGFLLFSIIHNNVLLLETSLMYLIIYIITILMFFTILLNLFTHNSIIYKVVDLFNISTYNKSISHLLTILIFSISGIPPFIGFISKLFWLKSLLFEYSCFTVLLILIFLIVSFYYMRIIKSVYYLFYSNSINYLMRLSYESCVIISLIQLLLLYFIFNSSIITNFIRIIVLNLLYIY